MIFELLLVSFIYSAQAFEPCNTVGELIPDPNSPGYFQCSNWGWQPMPCPEGLCFNPENSVCDWYVAETRCRNHSDVKPCEPVGELKPDPDDCHSFQQCGNSGWIKLKCREDLYFNPDLSVCVKPGPNDNCGGGNNHHHNDSDLEPCSNPGEIRPDTKHCDLYHECTDCGWSLIQCPSGQLFNPVKLVCDKADRVKCAQDGDLQPCDKIGEHKVDPKHCDLYYECTKCGWALVNCEAGLYYNPETSTCDNPENVNCGGVDPILKPCDNIGQLKPDDEHCDQYFKCTKKGWGSLPCEAGLLFNPKSLECEPASQVKCGGNNDDPTTTSTTTTTTASTTAATTTSTAPTTASTTTSTASTTAATTTSTASTTASTTTSTASTTAAATTSTSTSTTTSSSSPSGPCDHVDELRPDPKNCNNFYQCTPYGWQLMPCYGKLVFNPNINQCDYPQNYECKPSAMT